MASSAKGRGMQVLMLEKLSSPFIERNVQRDFDLFNARTKYL